MVKETLGATIKGITGNKGRLCSNESPYGIISNNDSVNYAGIYTMHRIVGWYDCKNLLRPGHQYFIEKGAIIKEFRLYQPPESEKYFTYPIVCGENGARMPRENPYRRNQIAKSHTARRISMIESLNRRFGLNNYKVSFLTLTFAKQISIYLSQSKSGTEQAWRMFKKYWVWYDQRFGSGLASSVNLHTWRSDLPLECHYHFHTIIPNYRIVSKDIDGIECLEFIEMAWHKQRGGRLVPLSEQELIEIKEKWFQIMSKFARLKKIDWDKADLAQDGGKSIDINIQYAEWNRGQGRIKLMHWFNYQGRYPLGDYAKYSNEHLECSDPPKWLSGYENHSRTYGWWNRMKILAGKTTITTDKISPLTGARMKYIGSVSVMGLLCSGRLGYLDIVKGKAVFHELRGKELAWLVSVSKLTPYDIINMARPGEY